jgi:hypothetical protein
VLGWGFDINVGMATLETCSARWNLLTNPAMIDGKRGNKD